MMAPKGRARFTNDIVWQHILDRSIPEPNSGCWLWLDMGQRYGQIGYEGKVQLAHRVVWIIHRGPIPDGMCVLHKCDVTWCVNPDHLFLGTQIDNIADMFNKGRATRSYGQKHFRAKLTDQLVREIRSSTDSTTVIARRLGLNWGTINDARKGKGWRHVKT